MAEYDAFGRKKGDNPLEHLSSGVEQPASMPPPAMPAPPRLPKRSAVAVVVAIAVLGSIGAATWLLIGSVEEGFVEPAAVEEAQPAAETAAPVTSDAPAARGLDDGSLITQPGLERALRAIRTADLGRPVSFRLAADRIDAQLATSDGSLRHVQVGPSGVPRELSLSAAGQVPSMPWSAIDPAAPERLVRAAAEREKRSARDVDYLVLLDLGEPTWGLFFEGGTHYQGDTAGNIVRRVSD